MLVFWDENLVLLAVPKTGSTALANALGPRATLVVRNPPELKHAPLYRYERFLARYFKTVCDRELETVAVVREPISWLGSWYRYRHRDSLVGHPNSTRGVSFSEFVAEYLKGRKKPFANVGSQAKFLEARPGAPALTRLFRYEAPERLARFLEERLGAPVRTRPANVSPDMDLTLAPDMETRLRRKCAAEFAVWESGQT